MSTQKKSTSSAKKTEYADNGVSSLLSSNDVTEDVNLSPLEKNNIEEDTSSDITTKYRDQLTEEELAAVKLAAPEIGEKMFATVNYIVDFGVDVLEGVNNVTSKLLKEQSSIKIPEIEQHANNILRVIDGYEKKYGKDSETIFKKLMNKIRGLQYDVKSSIRDTQSLEKKLDMAGNELYKMEQSQKENAIRGQELRKEMLKSISDIVRVLAIFEEVIEYMKGQLNEIEELVKGKEDDELIVWRGENYTGQEFREIQASFISSFGKVQKTWFSWRQRLFVYNTNSIAIRNIVNSSFETQHTIQQLRRETIDMAKTQIAQWQQARSNEVTANKIIEVKEISNVIIRRAAKGAADAIEASSKAANTSMLEEETLNAITDSMKSQFDSILRNEREGRAQQARNLAIIQQSEKTIKDLDKNAQQELVDDAMSSIRPEKNSDKGFSDNGKSNDVLSGLGIKI